jgi:hypothetical protein
LDRSSTDYIEHNNKRGGGDKDNRKKSGGGGGGCGDKKSSVVNTNHVSLSKKQIDHTLYWKIIVQDFAKKLDDSAREKDIQKEQAIGYII